MAKATAAPKSPAEELTDFWISFVSDASEQLEKQRKAILMAVKLIDNLHARVCLLEDAKR